jgi:hypothetical protein
MKSKRIIASGIAAAAIAAGIFIFINKRDSRQVRPLTPRVEIGLSQEAQARWQSLADSSLPREQRLDLAREINPRLNRAEANFLFDLMGKPAPGDPEDWWLVINEVMNQMLRCESSKNDYTRRMIDLMNDGNQPDVPRDYAIQHLGQWLSPGTPGALRETDPARRDEALGAMVAIVKDPSSVNTTLPGTALMVLADASSRLSADKTDGVWQNLEADLLPLIQGKTNARAPLRASAIQAVARNRRIAFLPSIRELAVQGSLPVVRLSAIAALGLYAQEEDKTFLTTLADLRTPFQSAARSALKNFPALDPAR